MEYWERAQLLAERIRQQGREQDAEEILDAIRYASTGLEIAAGVRFTLLYASLRTDRATRLEITRLVDEITPFLEG